MAVNNEVVEAVAAVIGSIAQEKENIGPQAVMQMFLNNPTLAPYVEEEIGPNGQRKSELASAVTIAGNIAAPMVKNPEGNWKDIFYKKMHGIELATSESAARALDVYLPIVLRTLATQEEYQDVFPDAALEMLRLHDSQTHS